MRQEKYLVMSGIMEYLVSFKIPIHTFDEVDSGLAHRSEARNLPNSGPKIQTESDRK